MILCWDQIILDDFQNGGIYKYGINGLEVFIPYDQISGFANYGNYLAFTTRQKATTIINFYNETDCENAIAHLCDMDLFFDEARYLIYNGEYDLTFGNKLFITDRYLYIVDNKGYCFEEVVLDDCEHAELYSKDYVQIHKHNDIGTTWRVGNTKCEHYGGFFYIHPKNPEHAMVICEIINKEIKKRNKR